MERMSENLSREQWGQRGWKSVEITTRALFPDCVARLGEQRACYRELVAFRHIGFVENGRAARCYYFRGETFERSGPVSSLRYFVHPSPFFYPKNESIIEGGKKQNAEDSFLR